MGSKRWILLAVVLGSGIVFLDSTVVNVALPEIGQDLSSSFFGVLEGQSFVYYGYLLTLSALLILAGAASDIYGRRKMFGIGLIGFGVTSVMCGLAPSLDLLILFRILQGAAGAILVPGSLSIITATFEGEEQGRAFGVWAGASAATTILGPFVGGAMVEYVTWRAVFLINLPLVLVGLWATYRHVEESTTERPQAHLDWVGAVIVAVAVGGLSLGAIRGQAQNWAGTDAYVAIGLGAIALVALPFWMFRSKEPLIPPELFRSRNFTVTNISTLLIYGSLYVTFQYMALFVIGTVGYNEIAFGIATIPSSLFLVAFSTRFGKLADRYGPRVFMTLGPVVMGGALLWFARFPQDSAPWVVVFDDASSFVPPPAYAIDLLPGLVLFGIGLMIMVAPLTTALMRSVAVQRSGLASAINNAISRVGPQLAGALLFIAISATFYAYLSSEVPSVDTSSSQIRTEISPLNPPPPAAGPELSEAIDAASTDAFRLAMLIAGLLCWAGAAVNAVGIRDETLRSTSAEPTVEAHIA